MNHKIIIIITGIIFFLSALCAGEKKDLLDPKTFEGLEFRCIGPAVTSGRISDLAVNVQKQWEYYVAVASGNLWKTTNAGITFEPVFENEGSYSIGCVTIDPNNPFLIWIGTGENNSQRSVSYGDGVYKSMDGGKNWENMGLKNSEHIAKILVDARNSNHVYVAAQGPLWAPGGDRGLYKTVDGGKTWNCILAISENTGVTDIVADPRDPDVLYAASYQRRRHVFTLINGGPESAIYKSFDAGKNWNKLSKGLPEANMGRIGLTISPANPDVIYAIIEAADDHSGFYQSRDRGATWEKRSDYVSNSPQYYQEIVADPLNVDRVYSLDTHMMVTDDGGKNFRRVGNKMRHVDDHALWIDPDNTDHLLVGGDGGIYETYDRGAEWEFKPNLPLTQFYRVAVDSAFPFYNVYGGTQDNSTVGGPSRTISRLGIVNSDWYITKGGDGFETQVDPENPDIVYSQSQYGWLVRYDRASGESIGIKPQIGKADPPLRWNWDSPLLISPHSPQRLYFAANKLFRSDDRGSSWRAVSPDLTRQIDRNKLEVMGRIWSVDAVSKNRSTSLYGNIVSLTESPLQENLIYIGTDDGLIQVTQDGGENWHKIERVKNVPENTYVSFLLASQHNSATVYATFDNHKNADFKPYLYKSTDKGESWQAIQGDLPVRGSVYTIAEDHINPDLLFAGTEFGVFFTIDGGRKWIQLKGELPTIAIKDIQIQKRENDLVLATFGRSFYVLDDYSPLRFITKESLDQEYIVFPVKDAWMYIQTRTGTGSQGSTFYAAENPSFGATITYYLKASIKTRKEQRQENEKKLIEQGKPVPYPSPEILRLEDSEEAPYLLFTIYDEAGGIIRRLNAPAQAGIHRITWDLRFPSPAPVNPEKNENEEEPSGMLVLPGTYRVTMSRSVDGVITGMSGPKEFEAKLLGLATLPAEDMTAAISFQRKVANLQRAVLGSIETIKEIRQKLISIKEAVRATPDADIRLWETVKNINAELNQMWTLLVADEALNRRNANTPPSISDRVNIIVGELWRTTSAPTETHQTQYRIAGELFEPVLTRLQNLILKDLAALETDLEDKGAPWTPGRVPRWQMEK